MQKKKETWSAYVHTVNPVCYRVLNPEEILSILSFCWSVENHIYTTTVVVSAAIYFYFFLDFRACLIFPKLKIT